MPKNRHLCFRVLLVVLCCAIFSTPAILNADESVKQSKEMAKQSKEIKRGTVVLERDGKKGSHDTEQFDFSSLFNKAADSCSGWCTCTDCGCSGSETCCAGGCGYCWGVLDGRGSC